MAYKQMFRCIHGSQSDIRSATNLFVWQNFVNKVCIVDICDFALAKLCRLSRKRSGMEISVKNKLDSSFFTRLFVPQASQNSSYRRAESDIRLTIPPTLKRLRNGD